MSSFLSRAINYFNPFAALPSTTNEPFYPTREEYYEAQQILMEHLPAELAEITLQEADYRGRMYGAAPRWFRVPSQPTWQTDGAVCCAVAGPVPENCLVDRVVFTMKSHDQGFGGEAQHRGTYEGSWTWFEAAILRFPLDSDFPQHLENTTVNLRALKHPELIWPEVTDEDGNPRRWHVQSNVTASSDQRTHVVTWRRNDRDEEKRPDPLKGTHDGGGEFISLLQPGDRVALIARAMFPLWVNNVDFASVETFYTWL